MIRDLSRPFWRIFAPLLAAVCFTSTVVPQLLDAADANHGPVLESKHDAATCPRGHDHTLCTQVGANLGVTTETPQHGVATADRDEARRPGIRERIPRGPGYFPLGSRAPPLA